MARVFAVRDEVAWKDLAAGLGREPARYRMWDSRGDAGFAVLHGSDCFRGAVHEVHGLTLCRELLWQALALVDEPEMSERQIRDLAVLDTGHWAAPECPVCGYRVRLDSGRFHVHPGKEPGAVEGSRRACPTSQETLAEAVAEARREYAELERLRRAPHP